MASMSGKRVLTRVNRTNEVSAGHRAKQGQANGRQTGGDGQFDSRHKATRQHISVLA